MQRVLSRAKRASRVVERAKAKDKKLLEREAKQERLDQNRSYLSYNNNLIREARRNRREDWALGPLAPRRDVGEQSSTYATLSAFYIQPPAREPNKRVEWSGIEIGDRVVLLKGIDRGKIGVVKEYNADSGSVTITGVNVVDAAVPAWMYSTDNPNGPTAIIPVSRPVRIEDVRLVYALPNEQGEVRDVVVDRLEKVEYPEEEARSMKKEKREKGYRSVYGTKTIIPWPAEAEEETPEAHPDDTLRIDVDEKTLTPTLLYHPMPPSVIDELRNKYSRFRTRHEYDFVEKVEAGEEKERLRKGLIRTMRTPLQELAEARAQKKKAERRELSDEDLAKIGAIMASQDPTSATSGETISR